MEADLFIDASGFRAELLGRAMAEPWISYENSLFCDRAVIGGWERSTEPIQPYTTAEAMDAGWCWRIDHETFINRGYVYSSRFISDDEARAEFLRKNPKAPADARVVKFRSGRFARPWVGNVIGIGNAAGMAYFYWNCSWEDVYLNGTDQTLKAKALTQMKKFPNTSWGSKYYDDSSGIWVDVVKKASLGDLSELQQFYDSDCSYYRQVNHK